MDGGFCHKISIARPIDNSQLLFHSPVGKQGPGDKTGRSYVTLLCPYFLISGVSHRPSHITVVDHEMKPARKF